MFTNSVAGCQDRCRQLAVSLNEAEKSVIISLALRSDVLNNEDEL